MKCFHCPFSFVLFSSECIKTLIYCSHVKYFHCPYSFVLFSSECTKTCENGGVLDPDKCFCNCSATDYIGDRCEGMCLCILSELLFICCNTFAANCGRLDYSNQCSATCLSLGKSLNGLICMKIHLLIQDNL